MLVGSNGGVMSLDFTMEVSQLCFNYTFRVVYRKCVKGVIPFVVTEDTMRLFQVWSLEPHVLSFAVVV